MWRRLKFPKRICGAGIAGATALRRVPPIKYNSAKNLDQSLKRTRS